MHMTFTAEYSALWVCFIQTDTFLIRCHWRVEEPYCWGCGSKKDKKIVGKHWQRKQIENIGHCHWTCLYFQQEQENIWKIHYSHDFMLIVKDMLASVLHMNDKWKAPAHFLFGLLEPKSLILKKIHQTKLSIISVPLNYSQLHKDRGSVGETESTKTISSPT